MARRDRGAARLELLEPVGDRLAREIRRRARHLDERELERQAGIATLAHVVDGDGEQVDQAYDRRLAELVRLRAQPLLRLLGDGQRLRHLVHVLHEHQVPQVLDQIADEPAEVVSLLRQLFDERQRGRWKTNVWQRERTVGRTFERSVVQKTKTRWGGGSSISFSKAFHAASVS